LAKLLRAAHVRPGKLAEALQKAESTGRQLEDMPFRSRLELVTCLVARIDVLQPSLRITFRITGVVRYLSGDENLDHPQEEETVFVDFPLPSISQNGSVKVVVTQPSQKSEDASLIAAIARGTCWFEELTSGKASSISGIASRERVTDSYVSRLLNLALLAPTIVDQVLNGNPAATEIARHEMTGRRLSALWGNKRSRPAGQLST
jgi:site-specific DNA recombinase